MVNRKPISAHHAERPEGVRVIPPETPEPVVEIVDITPAMAETWLTMNTRNRRLVEPRVRNYVRDMLANRWRPYLSMVVFAADGTLLDGQHRLQAIAVSGTTQRFIAVRGVPLDDQHVLDRGRKRTVSDDLKIAGRKYYTLVASLSNAVMAYEHRSFVHRNWAPTESEQHAFEQEHTEELGRAAEIGSRVRSLTGASPTAAALAYYICARINQEQADAFFESVASGAGLSSGSPALTLRNRLIRSRDPARRERLKMAEEFAFYALAWNATRQNRKLVKVQLPRGVMLTEKNLPRPA